MDEDRVYVTGLSMGGFATWALAIRQPQRFAAVAPVCGGGDPSKAERIARLPIWAFHGALDETIPLDAQQQIVDALHECGGNVEFTVFPDEGHNIDADVYNDPELHEWLLAQSLD